MFSFARLRKRSFEFAAMLFVVALGRPGAAATSGANGSHDPSRITESDGKFYFCSTGGSCASSSDGLNWAATGLHINVPSWANTYVSDANQGIWAPDIVYYNGTFHIYYSFVGPGSVPQRACAIGLYTTPTLDSTSAKYKLTDAGVVVDNSSTNAVFSTIDPGPIVDPSGNLWMSWGSGFGHDFAQTQLWLTRLDSTGLALKSDPGYQPPVMGRALQPGRKEASYVHYHDGNYFLFYNTGGCCAGTASTYEIWVARSASITGPFTGDKVFLASHDDIHGPGHMGIYDDCGFERFTYHYYPTDKSILGENELTWGADGWPVAGAESTTPLKPCGSNSGSAGGSGSGGSAGASADGGASGANLGGTAGANGTLGGAAGNSANLGGAAGANGSPGGAAGNNANLGGLGGSSSAAPAGGDTAASSGGETPVAGGGQSSVGGGLTAGSPSGADASPASSSGCACTLFTGGKRGNDGLLALVVLAASLTWARRSEKR